MKKLLTALTIILGSIGFSHAQMDRALTIEDVSKQLVQEDGIEFQIDQVSILVWPANHIGVKAEEGQQVYGILVRNKCTRKDMLSVPYTSLQVFDKDGNYLGMSNQTYGSFFGDNRTDIFSIALDKDVDITELQVFLLSGFGQTAEVYEVPLAD
jgi:hypothetical protein